tara:strand:+ start:345 stop:560 length:216 start_codon:yes stop_codon:yes gene_type:complete
LELISIPRGQIIAELQQFDEGELEVLIVEADAFVVVLTDQGTKILRFLSDCSLAPKNGQDRDFQFGGVIDR